MTNSVAYKYDFIVLTMEDAELSSKQYRALLKSDTPVADVFERFRKRKTSYMDIVLDTLESQANEIIRED